MNPMKNIKSYIVKSDIDELIMKHYKQEWIEEWCQENGWTDLYIEKYKFYWAFPPGAVMPEPIPSQIMQKIKAEKGFTPEEKFWSISAVICTILAILSAYLLKCPIPLVLAFAFDAATVAQLEMEDF
jgi:hypothetical protein